MRKGTNIVFDKDGIEYRRGLDSIYIRLTEISSMKDIEGSAATRIVLNNGRSYLVVNYADCLIFDSGEKQNLAPAVSFAPINPAMADLCRFRLIKEECEPKSWLGRMFADAAHFVKGDDPLPPIRVTHDLKGRKLSRAELKKIYDKNGHIETDYVEDRPHLAP